MNSIPKAVEPLTREFAGAVARKNPVAKIDQDLLSSAKRAGKNRIYLIGQAGNGSK